MVKVKTKALSKAPGQEVSGKKAKDERKVLKVISKGNGSAQPTVSLKAKKKNRRSRNKANKNGTQNEAPSEINNEEVKPGVEDLAVESQESNTESKEQQEDEKSGDAQSSDISSELKEEKDPTSMTAKRLEPESKVIGSQEPTNETTESEDSQKSGKLGKNKRNRKKRKASEALKDTEDTTGTIENKGDGEDATEGEKLKKRQKVEDKNEGENSAKKDKSKTKGQKEKKHVLFIGNLPFDATEDDIREHFKVVGKSIVRVTLMSRQKNAKGKGYGFLELTDAAAYSTALKLNLSQLKDRKINVEFTTPGKNTKKRKSFIKLKTKKLLGQKKGNKGRKKKGGRKH